MLAALEQIIIPSIEHLYAQVGYLGVLIAMAIESACIPLPSEIIMPLAGWMVYRGVFNLWAAVIAGTAGCTLGSIFAYWVGAWGGRPVLARYGRYVLISEHDLETADHWFARYGDAAIFFSRLLPVVRTFISFPAGVTRMNFAKFVLYTTLGSFPWVLGLAYAGKLMGDNWVVVREVLKNFDYPIAAIIVAAVAYYVYRHVKSAAGRQESENTAVK